MSEVARSVRQSLIRDFSAIRHQREFGGMPDDLTQKYGAENIVTHRFMGAAEEAISVLIPLGLAVDLDYSIIFALADEETFLGYNYSRQQDIAMAKLLFGLEGIQNGRFPTDPWEPFDIPPDLAAAFEHITKLDVLAEIDGKVMWNEEINDCCS